MITEAFVDDVRVAIDPARAIGKGGEADVYDLGDGRALKIFKTPDHPDYQSIPAERRAAEERIAEHQQKLRTFPRGLPAEVVSPTSIARDRRGDLVLGYAMPLVTGAVPLTRLSDPTYRRTAAPSDRVVSLFSALLRVVRTLHATGVIVGDFNDLNILVTSDGRPRLIDADSFQFGPFLCHVFTERFVDPNLCDPSHSAPRLSKPYTRGADWYALTALLFQSLLCVGPYGGVFRPSGAERRIPPRERPLRGVTVFDRAVQYPKPAIPYRTLPDDLLHHFHSVFEKGDRAPFPHALLGGMRFSRCHTCGVEHARPKCPLCSVSSHAATAAAPSSSQTNDRVRREKLFQTDGTIVHSAIENGELRFVYYDRGAYKREDGSEILRGPLDPTLHIRTLGDETLFGRGRELAIVSCGSKQGSLSIDTCQSGAAFDTNGRHRFRVDSGRLLRDEPSALDRHAARTIGAVLTDQTRVWVGPTFGVGFYRAGTLARVFVFGAERGTINDDLRLPPYSLLGGELVDSNACIDETRAWLFFATKHAGRVTHRCFVYSRTGQLEASHEADPGDGTWLGTLFGKCATAGLLLAATDAGIVRVEVSAGAITQTREFTETEPFVDASCQILVGRLGLYIVTQQEIFALQMKQ